MAKKHLTPENLTKLMESMMAQGLINLEVMEQTAQHEAVLAGGCGPVIEPFLRDLLLLEPADEHATPRPDWVTEAALLIHCSVAQSGMAGRSTDLLERLGSAGGAALGLNQAPSPFEDPSPEVEASWKALADLAGDSVRDAQQKANALPAQQRAKFYAGFARGTARDLVEEDVALFGSYGNLLLITIWGWREIIALRNRRQFHDWLDARLGPELVGGAKRVEHFCQEIGLKFAGRGRPKNNTQS